MDEIEPVKNQDEVPVEQAIGEEVPKQASTVDTRAKYLLIAMVVVLALAGTGLGFKWYMGLSGIGEKQPGDTMGIGEADEQGRGERQEVAIDDWILYQNDELGFSFRYPKGWEVSVKDYKDGKKYSFASLAGYEWRELSEVIRIDVTDPGNPSNQFTVRYKKNELSKIKMMEGDVSYKIDLDGGMQGTVYRGKGFTPFDSTEKHDIFIVRYEGDLLELNPYRNFNALYDKIASTIAFTSVKNPKPSIPVAVTKEDLAPYFNNLYKCSSAKEEWQCFDENLNISERQLGTTPNTYDVTAYKEGRVFTSFSDITGDGHDDATVMIYYKRFSSETVYLQSVFVLTRDIGITGNPERDIFILYLNEAGARGQLGRGFTAPFPLESWVGGTLYIGGPNYPSLDDERRCNQLGWDEENKLISSLKVACRR